MNPKFSINRYDNDGELLERGVFVHLDNGFIIKFDTVEQIRNLSDKFRDIADYIEDPEEDWVDELTR